MSSQRATIVTVAARACAVVLVMTRMTPVSAAEATMTIACQIRATALDDMLRLEAIAKGPQAASGTYQFEVSKQSPTGTSQNVQSGAFELETDRDATLTTIILDRSARGHYRARLTLDSQEFGRISCVSP
jgi:predicted aspartyl protease